MDFFMKPPRNKKEFAVFIAVISIISVHIIAPLITYVPAEWLTHKFVREGDSFSAVMAVNILCTVLMMSVILTVVGTWIGIRHISMEPIFMFFHKWPRNFAISLGVEMVIGKAGAFLHHGSRAIRSFRDSILFSQARFTP